MARLELGVDVTVEGAAKLDGLSKELRGTGDELGDLAKSLDDAADAARRMQEDINRAADGIDFSGANNAAQRFEDTGEGLRNFANGASDAFTAATDSSLSFQERFTLAAGGVADVANGMRNAILPALENISSGALTSAGTVVRSIGTQVAAWATMGTQTLLHAGKVALAWVIALGPIALLVGAVIAAVALIIANWEHVSKFIGTVLGIIGKALEGFARFFGEVWNGIVEFFEGVWNGMLDFLKGIGKSIVRIGETLWEPIGEGFGAAIDFIKGIWNAFAGWWNSIEVSVPSIDIPFVGKVGGFNIGLPDLPMLAKGGIVTRPTLAVLGESGPEAVVPLGHGVPGGVTFNFYGEVKADTTDDVASAVRRSLWVSGMTDRALNHG